MGVVVGDEGTENEDEKEAEKGVEEDAEEKVRNGVDERKGRFVLREEAEEAFESGVEARTFGRRTKEALECEDLRRREDKRDGEESVVVGRDRAADKETNDEFESKADSGVRDGVIGRKNEWEGGVSGYK